MSQDSSLVQWTTSTGALHLARTAVGSAILSLWLFDCSTSSALNIQISAQQIWYLTGGRAELHHCSLILLSILLLQVMMMVTMTMMIMMIMMVMMITIMMMEILQALAHQATPARQAANHFLGEASTMIQTPNQQSRCIYVRVSIISSIPLIIVFHHSPPLPHVGTWSRRLAIVTRELRSMWAELGGSSVQRRWKFERSGHFLLVTTVESSTRKGNDDDNNKQATGKTI